MAHASSREAMLLQMKKLRKIKAKKKAEEIKKREEMTDEEYTAYCKRRFEKTLYDKVQLALWDYDHKQFPVGKYDYLKKLLKNRILEIEQNEERETENELKRIEVVLNELSAPR